MADQYDTQLSPEQEKAYQEKYGPEDSRDYDTRGFFKSGAAQAGNGHFPDTFKKPSHPTFSDESQYHGMNGNEGGKWDQSENGRWNFTPGKTNIENGLDKTRAYLAANDNEVHLRDPSDPGEQEVAAHAEYERNPAAGGLPPWSSVARIAMFPYPQLIDAAKNPDVQKWIGKHLMYDADPDSNKEPHFEFGGQAEKTGIPAQWMIDGKVTRVSPEEARKYAGEPGLAFHGPGAEEANDYLTSLRINAGIPKDAALPDVYLARAKLRDEGKSWDEINQMEYDAKVKMMADGYSNTQINKILSGLPLDGYVRAPNVKPGISENFPDWLGTNIRRGSELFGKYLDWMAEKALGVNNTGLLYSGLPNVGGDYTIGGMLKHIGWSTLDFVKTFGALPMNGAAALAELADGKERSNWEKLNLAWEAKDFLLLFAFAGGKKPAAVKPGAAVEPPIPSHEDFFDAAIRLSKMHPNGMDQATLNDALRGVGQHYQATGEHPITTAMAVNTYEQWLGKWQKAQENIANNNVGGGFMGEHVIPQQLSTALARGITREELLKSQFNVERIKERGEKALDARERAQRDAEDKERLRTDDGDGAKHPDPMERQRQDMMAQDKVMPPDKVEAAQVHAFNDDNAKWRTLMSDDEGRIGLTPRRDIEPDHLFKRDPEIADGLIADLRRHFSPASLEQGAGELISSRMAQSIQESERGAHALLRFGRVVGEMATGERWKYIDAIERNDLSAYAGTLLGALAREIRNQLDFRFDQMEKLGIAPEYIEGYLKHLYIDPKRFERDWTNKATNLSSSPFSANKTLAGGTSFLRERMFGSYKEARAAGMIAATDNPITMSLMAMRNMDRYIAAYQLLKDLERTSTVKAFKKDERRDAGMTLISGQLGLAKGGNLYAPRDIADKINSLTETGLQKFSTYRLIRGAGNQLISIQLSASGYHWFFVTNDTFTSQLALAAQQLSRGILNPTHPIDSVKEIFQGFKTAAFAVAAPIEAGFYGTRMKTVLSDAQKMKGASEELKKISDAWVQGGGRMELPEEYRGTAYGDFATSVMGSVNYWSGDTMAKSFSGYQTFGQKLGEIFRNSQPIKVHGVTVSPAYLNAVFSLIPRTLETASAPLMSYYVPMMKRGVFYMQMQDALRLAPEMSEVEMRHVANMKLKSIDNRLGLLTYDNRFWNKTFRDLSHVMVRAVGWNVGDLAEIGGGLYDTVRLRTEKIGQMRSITPRTAYVLGTIASTMMLGAMVGVMSGTWREDWGPTDYLFPVTESGLRIAMPTYGKDIYNAFTKPGEVITSKVNPIWPMLNRMITNRDYNGGMIADYSQYEDNGPAPIAEDYLRWLGRTALPIAVLQQMKPTDEQKEIDPLLRFIGINPAPWAVRNPEKTEKFQHKEEKGARKKYNKQKARDEGEDE